MLPCVNGSGKDRKEQNKVPYLLPVTDKPNVMTSHIHPRCLWLFLRDVSKPRPSPSLTLPALHLTGAIQAWG